MKRLTKSTLVATLLLCFAGAANASNIIQDGNFLDTTIGIGFNPATPWNDWTDAGITVHPFSNVFLGNYASLPNSPNGGSDLFQRFSPLSPGEYTLSFLVQNQSPWSAELAFTGAQQAGGTSAFFLIAIGTGGLITLPANSPFILSRSPST